MLAKSHPDTLYHDEFFEDEDVNVNQIDAVSNANDVNVKAKAEVNDELLWILLTLT